MESFDEKHFCFSHDRGQRNCVYNKRMNKTHPKMWAVHRNLANRRSHLSATKSQAQGRGTKENSAENVGHAETT